MFRVNSKIKKHLVDEIDFEQIQKMFYKKRETITRYQYFLQSKKNKNKDKNENDTKNTKHQGHHKTEKREVIRIIDS